jgi:prealbumin domain-containing protein/coenzyme PQQ synthesis protein D (PqqD)
MALLDIEVLRTSAELVAQTLPDGSTAIFEVPTKNVYSLNRSAAAAWEACASATTLPQIAAGMSKKLGIPVTEDLAHEAVSELAAVGLVKVTSGESLGASRRDVLKQVAGLAVPVVLVLTGAEQRAHAQVAGSQPALTTTTPTVTTTHPLTTTPTITTTAALNVCASFQITLVKGVDQPDGSVLPLAGAVFSLRDPGNNEVIALTTDANGAAQATLANLPVGTYKLVEVSAPGGPFQPFIPRDVVVDVNCTPFIRNLHNILA